MSTVSDVIEGEPKTISDRGQYFIPPSEAPKLGHECDRGGQCSYAKYVRGE